jgi:hypothetical protein
MCAVSVALPQHGYDEKGVSPLGSVVAIYLIADDLVLSEY